jgi:hypothetical protein
VLDGGQSIKSVLENVVVHVASCCHSVEYVFNEECKGMLNISVDNHVLFGTKQTVYVEMPIYISCYL